MPKVLPFNLLFYPNIVRYSYHVKSIVAFSQLYAKNDCRDKLTTKPRMGQIVKGESRVGPVNR
jgi:hypothetical protein